MPWFAQPRKAATLVILREGEKSGEDERVLMLLRHKENKFVPSSYVFPGGAVEEEDLLPPIQDRCMEIPEKGGSKIFPKENHREITGFWIAAIRETFEESGLLFAYDESGSMVSLSEDPVRRRFEAYRKELHDKTILFSRILETEALTLATDRIQYLSHWVTPPFSSIRYDTRFFLAKVPQDQTASPDERELVKKVWISPANALLEYRRGRFPMVHPTIMTLEKLARNHRKIKRG